jgi:transposase
MAGERLLMSNIREILRLRWELKRSVREAASSVGVSTGVVSQTTQRAAHAKLSWAEVEGMDDGELEAALYASLEAADSPIERPMPDPIHIHQELRRPGVTLELLHLEFLEEHPDGYRYTAFCDVYRKWLKRRGLTMRQLHKAGDKLFQDFSGKKPCIVDRQTGARIEVELYVAVLGASNYTYAEATATQRLADWIGANIHTLEFIEGVPNALVPDQLRSAVSEPCASEPTIQRTMAAMAAHYGTAVVPARPGKARDKAKVEVAVQVAQRWIVARLRNETHFSIESLNGRIRELLEELNSRPMKRYGGLSRRELFERVERAALGPLPERPYVCAIWRKASVGSDYHAKVEEHLYSVPCALAHEAVEARVTSTTVEVFYLGRRVASHVRSDEVGGSTTNTAHMPAHHREWAVKDPAPLLAWARSVGTSTELLMTRVLESNFHRDQTYRSGRGLKGLGELYPPERIEEASRRVVAAGARSYKHVERILKLGLDLVPHPDEVDDETMRPIEHDQVRGPDYYLN